MNIYRVLSVLSPKQEQERGIFLRVWQSYRGPRGTHFGKEIRERLKKGSSSKEKPWRLERLGHCGNLLGEVCSALLFPVGEMRFYAAFPRVNPPAPRCLVIGSNYIWLVRLK